MGPPPALSSSSSRSLSPSLRSPSPHLLVAGPAGSSEAVAPSLVESEPRIAWAIIGEGPGWAMGWWNQGTTAEEKNSGSIRPAPGEWWLQVLSFFLESFRGVRWCIRSKCVYHICSNIMGFPWLPSSLLPKKHPSRGPASPIGIARVALFGFSGSATGCRSRRDLPRDCKSGSIPLMKCGRFGLIPSPISC